MSHRESLQKQISFYTRRLHKLREQEAMKGSNTPSEILMEIDDIEAKLPILRAKLEDASSEPDLPLSNAELAEDMTRQPQNTPPSSSTQIGGFNLSNVSGSTITIGNVSANLNAGGDIVGGDKVTTHITSGAVDQGDVQTRLEAALDKWRQELEAKIATLADLDDEEKNDLKKQADKVQQEAVKGEAASPGKLERLLNAMSAMAPDILEVTATTLQNPFAGVGLVLKKINDRIKLERAK
ncbi:MAG: hypothetical protein KDJ52_23310 [Anaerolineae bacterium]|nr:hypothetical protein [Anaerolineae bacterium]